MQCGCKWFPDDDMGVLFTKRISIYVSTLQTKYHTCQDSTVGRMRHNNIAMFFENTCIALAFNTFVSVVTLKTFLVVLPRACYWCCAMLNRFAGCDAGTSQRCATGCILRCQSTFADTIDAIKGITTTLGLTGSSSVSASS